MILCILDSLFLCFVEISQNPIFVLDSVGKCGKLRSSLQGAYMPLTLWA